ncbi:hypothetical protein CEE45_07570 [Candidatus Heimdallarchaeota archaeon B3_Heim]|nr:MAG: hypothetical protein CEE45_07570 [Candidatus Heimdallarchaeota archaeon B3_Heim]
MKEFSLKSITNSDRTPLYTYLPGQTFSFAAKFSHIPDKYHLQILDRKENTRLNRYGKGSDKGIEFQWPIPKLLRDRHLGFWQIYIESDSENFQLFFEVKNPATFFSGE